MLIFLCKRFKNLSTLCTLIIFLQILFSTKAGANYSKQMQILTISDLDKKSANKTTPGIYMAYLKEGTLNYDQTKQKVSVRWQRDPHKITSTHSYKGRGMELSTLNNFNGKLYSCDDKTGIVFELRKVPCKFGSPGYEAVPWITLLANTSAVQELPANVTNGSEGFKCEWATVKGLSRTLWIGGHGNRDYKSVRVITPEGQVTVIDWSRNYERMAKALGVEPPGYVVHEAAAWSDFLQRWIFLPRKISKVAYNPITDETLLGSNKLIIADEHFEKIEIHYIGPIIKTHGFSAIKFLPGTEDQIVVALKTVEIDKQTESYILVADLKKHHLLFNETKFADEKYEGLEFARRKRRKRCV